MQINSISMKYQEFQEKQNRRTFITITHKRQWLDTLLESKKSNNVECIKTTSHFFPNLINTGFNLTKSYQSHDTENI